MLTIGFLMALSALNSNDVVTVYPKRDCVQTVQTRTTKVLNDSVVLFELKDWIFRPMRSHCSGSWEATIPGHGKPVF